jgi:hypothetical protein
MKAQDARWEPQGGYAATADAGECGTQRGAASSVGGVPIRMQQQTPGSVGSGGELAFCPRTSSILAMAKGAPARQAEQPVRLRKGSLFRIALHLVYLLCVVYGAKLC